MSESSEDETGLRIQTDVNDAVSHSVATHENGMVTKWVMLVEVIDEQGERGLWTMTSPDARGWDTVGMLQHGLYIQHSRTFEGNRE